jgi:ankyrin repeat protein
MQVKNDHTENTALFLLNAKYFNLVRGNENGLELVRYLISQGVDVNRENIYGRTALSHSLTLSSNQVIKLLLSLQDKSKINNTAVEKSLLIKAALNGNFF